MALPVTFNRVPVHIKIVGLDGSPGKGTVTWEAPVPVANIPDKAVIGNARKLTATLDNQTGEVTILVPATNDPDNTPVGWTYTVTVNTDVLNAKITGVEVPYNDDIIEFYELLSATVPPSNGENYLPLAGGTLAGALTVNGPFTANNFPALDALAEDVTSLGTDLSTAEADISGMATALSGKADATALAGKEPTIAAGTTPQYYRGDKTWQTLDKAAVGLANVNNTADSAKPVSTAQQAALDLKLTKTDVFLLAKDFGAVGNNIADDSPKLQAMLDAIPASGGIAFIGPGNYKLTAALRPKTRTTIVGAGALTTLLRPVADINAIELIGTSSVRAGQVHIKDLAIIGPGKAVGSAAACPRTPCTGSVGDAIHIEWGGMTMTFERLYIEAMRCNGIWTYETYINRYTDVWVTGCGMNGFWGVRNCNHVTWEHCNFLANELAGARVDGGACSAFYNSDFESNNVSGLDLRYTNNFVVSGCEIENSGVQGIYLHWGTNAAAEKAVATTITGCGITGTGRAQYGINVDGANLTELVGNQLINNLTNHINVTVNASRTRIGWQSYSGVPSGGNIADASTTSSYWDTDTNSGLPRTKAIKFEPGAAPIGAPAGGLWYQNSTDRFRHYNATGSAVREMYSGFTGTVTFTNATIPAQGTVDATGPIPSATIGQAVVLSGTVTLPAGVVMSAFVAPAGNAVTVRLFNTTATPITGYTGTHQVRTIV